MEEVSTELGLPANGAGTWARHPLVFLVEAADDICYAIIDLEDAFEMEILQLNEVENILTGGLSPQELDEFATLSDADPFRRLGYLRGKVVDHLVREVISAFAANEDAILSGDFGDDLISRCNEQAREIVRAAKLTARERIFVAPRKIQIEIGAYTVVDVLLRTFCSAYIEHRESRISFKSKHIFDLLGINAPNAGDALYPALVRITDFVSGCTDKYAAELSQRLSGIAF